MLAEIHTCAYDPLAWLAWRDYLEERGEPYRQPTLTVAGITFALIPPGRFLMGSPEDEQPYRYDDEAQHEVEIAKAFYLGVYPVTQAQWQAVMGSNPSRFKGDSLPVETVSWHDCQAFCNCLSAKTGRVVRQPPQKKYTFRLPFESEWEYACRAGTTTAYYSGNGEAVLGLAGWYYGNSGGKTHPVGKLAANAWGLYDMHGNVWEWCADWYGGNYEGGGEASASPPFPGLGSRAPRRRLGQQRQELPRGRPQQARAGRPEPAPRVSGGPVMYRRVLRGGSCYNYAALCRSAFRGYDDPGSRGSNCGFRVVLVPA
jgi:formylglycine-generating enzyme required for sulfatase activity